MFFKKSFRNRLIIVFLIVVFTPLIFLGAITYSDVYDYLSTQKEDSTVEDILNDSELVNLWLEGKISILKSITSSLSFNINSIHNSKMMYDYLYYQKYRNNQEVMNLYITTVKGDNYNSNYWGYENITEDLRKRVWYVGAKEKDGVFISKPYEDIMTGSQVITISLPIKNIDGEFLGVLGADYKFSNIVNMIKTISMGRNTLYAVFMTADDENTLLYNNSPLEAQDLQPVLSSPKRIIGINNEKEKYIGINTSFESVNLEVIALQDSDEYYSQINGFLISFIFICGIAALLIIFSILYISKKISMPVTELKKGVKDILGGNLDIELKTASDDDFRELMVSFNIMAQTMKDNYNSLAEQSQDLFDKNDLLQDINTELEASLNQLEATSEQLNQSESKYRSLIENIPDLIWVMDNHGNINFINDSVTEMLGYNNKDLFGKSISNIMCPLHKYENCGDIIEEFNNKDFKNYDLWFLKSNKEERIILEANTNRILDYKGDVISIQGIGRNVTEKRKMEAQILRKNSELRIINEISYALTNKMKLDDILKTIVDKIHELFKVEICSIRLLQGNNLIFKAAAGEHSDYIKRQPINIYEDMIGQAVSSKEMIIFKDYMKDTSYKKEDKLYSILEDVKELLAIPLKSNNEVSGVLVIGFEKEISENDVDTLKLFSSYTAVAIEKAKLYENLKHSYFKTIKALATAVEAKDSYTEGHSIRVSKYSTLIAKHMGLKEDKIEELYIAGILHDIGKIGIDDYILTKPGRLSKEEFFNVKKHPVIGHRILNEVGLSQDILNGVLLHHKRFDLTGYPEDINIDHLPLEAQIIGVADAFDAMTTNRSYCIAKNIGEALEELKWYKGTQFCPEIVDVMENIFYNYKNELEDIINLDNWQL